MSPTTVDVLAGIAVSTLVVLGAMSLWLVIRARLAPKAQQSTLLGEALDVRLTDMARAIDAIAIEVERIGEAQRYLLLERRNSPTHGDQRSQQGRTITPH
jgi:hypothetical protein